MIKNYDDNYYNINNSNIIDNENSKYKFKDRSYPKRREIKSGFERAFKAKKNEWKKKDKEYKFFFKRKRRMPPVP